MFSYLSIVQKSIVQVLSKLVCISYGLEWFDTFSDQKRLFAVLSSTEESNGLLSAQLFCRDFNSLLITAVCCFAKIADRHSARLRQDLCLERDMVIY